MVDVNMDTQAQTSRYVKSPGVDRYAGNIIMENSHYDHRKNINPVDIHDRPDFQNSERWAWNDISDLLMFLPITLPVVHSPNMVSDVKLGYWNNRNYNKSSNNSELGERKNEETEQVSHYKSGYTHQSRNRQSGQVPLAKLQRNQFGNRRPSGWLNRRETQRPLAELVLPERFMARPIEQDLQFSCLPPADSQWRELSLHIYNRYLYTLQTSEAYKRKINLWQYLSDLLRKPFPKYDLYVVGSTMNGFGNCESDIDMCLLVQHLDLDFENMRREAIHHLQQVSKYLQTNSDINGVHLIRATVPILRFSGMGHSVDLNCNSTVSIRNTHLLYCYSQLDSRVQPIVVIVKQWAAKHNINDAKTKTISSYSLSLMVIHFLQCGVSPPILPCLQKLYKDKFSPRRDVSTIVTHELLPPYRSTNRDSLGELLLGFLHYYSRFDYARFAISVRLASKVPIEDCKRMRTFRNSPQQWKFLCVEEPFDLTNTARSVYDEDTFKRIMNVLCLSFKELKRTRSLESIL